MAGLNKSEMAQIDAMAAAAGKPNINLMAGMIAGDPQAANMSSQLQAQASRAGAQRVSGLQSALQAKAQSRDVGARQTTLQSARVKSQRDAANLARQQAESDYTRDRKDEVTDLEFKRQQAMDLAELRNQRMTAQGDREKARLNRQERRFRMTHHKTQQPKDLGPTLSKSLHEKATTIRHMDDSLTTFRDDFAADIGIIGRGQNIISGEFGISTSKAMDDQAAWWRDYKRFIELVERHEFFGATLTKGENISWKQAEIQAGMKPAEIRKNLKKRGRMMKDLLEEYAEGITISKKNFNAVNALVGGSLPGFNVPKELYIEPFPEHILEGQAGVDEKDIDEMTMEEMQEEVNRLKEAGGG
jgi:hypothetical protein